MSQNTSHAVMQQRHEAHDSLDDFPTPSWAGRALCEHVIAVDSHEDSVWEPAANRGFLARGLSSYFRLVIGSDIHDYGAGYKAGVDFLLPGSPFFCGGVDWVITNPPFRLAEQFARRGLDVARKGVALLTRTSFLEGAQRHRDLFAVHPPLIVAQFVERVPMVKGRCDPKASTATSYCWIVWVPDRQRANPTEFVWIPPCRKRLERAGDYDLHIPEAA